MTASGAAAVLPKPTETQASPTPNVPPPSSSALVALAGAESLQEELAVVGYAKVIATLKPEPAHTAFLAATTAALASSTQATESSLAAHFIVPAELQATSLALVSRRSSGRRPASAPARAPRRVRVYPKLGLAIGYVDAAGLAGLAADGHVQKGSRLPS